MKYRWSLQYDAGLKSVWFPSAEDWEAAVWLLRGDFSDVDAEIRPFTFHMVCAFGTCARGVRPSGCTEEVWRSERIRFERSCLRLMELSVGMIPICSDSAFVSGWGWPRSGWPATILGQESRTSVADHHNPLDDAQVCGLYGYHSRDRESESRYCRLQDVYVDLLERLRRCSEAGCEASEVVLRGMRRSFEWLRCPEVLPADHDERKRILVEAMDHQFGGEIGGWEMKLRDAGLTLQQLHTKEDNDQKAEEAVRVAQEHFQWCEQELKDVLDSCEREARITRAAFQCLNRQSCHDYGVWPWLNETSVGFVVEFGQLYYARFDPV
jgi:hypothetical protein